MTQTPIKAEIDLQALTHNAQVAQSLAPSSRQLAMVKANAYGHGLVPVARALAPYVSGFGIARLSEAMQLQQLCLGRDIVLMTGFLTPEELITCSNYGFTPVVHNHQQIKLIQQTQLPYPISIWLKINTGMGRLGFHQADFATIYQQLAHCPNITQPIGVMSHLANAGTQQAPTASEQYQQLVNTIKDYPVRSSLANSAALLAHDIPADQDWVRPGIMLYGASPLSYLTADELNLKPVMTLKSKLIAINQLQAGDSVGYGSQWVCPQTMPVGVVAIGYGDGYPRGIDQKAHVIINQGAAPVIGRISMDMLTVDLTGIKNAQEGDEVILWGRDLAIETVANWADTIAYDLMCRVNQTQARVQFQYNK